MKRIEYLAESCLDCQFFEEISINGTAELPDYCHKWKQPFDFEAPRYDTVPAYTFPEFCKFHDAPEEDKEKEKT